MRIEAIGSEQAYINSRTITADNTKYNSKEAKVNHVEMMNKEAEVATTQNVREKDVIDAIEKANKHIRSFDRRLEFSIHEMTKQIMVKVINTADDTVVREIPSEKVLDMVAHMWEVAGILVDEKR